MRHGKLRLLSNKLETGSAKILIRAIDLRAMFRYHLTDWARSVRPERFDDKAWLLALVLSAGLPRSPSSPNGARLAFPRRRNEFGSGSVVAAASAIIRPARGGNQRRYHLHRTALVPYMQWIGLPNTDVNDLQMYRTLVDMPAWAPIDFRPCLKLHIRRGPGELTIQNARILCESHGVGIRHRNGERQIDTRGRCLAQTDVLRLSFR